MEDEKIINLYFERDESALSEVALKYGAIGIAVNVKDSFNNGYIFKSGYITENEDVFDNNETNKYKGLDCEYIKGNNELCIFFEPQTTVTEKIDNQAGIIYKDCELVYYSYKNKFVPSDYKMTEQDIKDKASGKYVFSYGSEEVFISDIQGVFWTQSGISFEILDNSSAVSKDELIKMAKELIDYQGGVTK